MSLDRRTWLLKTGRGHKAFLRFNTILTAAPVTGVRAHVHTHSWIGGLQCSWRERYLPWQK